MRATFRKMHGCGNDFIVFDERPRPLGLTPARAAGLARLLDHIGRFDGVWVTRRIDIARHWATHFPAPL